MQLIDKYLPEYSFKEVHYREVLASPATVTKNAANYRPENDPFFRKMIGLREMPMRIRNLLSTKRGYQVPPFGLHNFTLLEKQDDAELVYGLIGRFWRPNFGLVTIPDGDAFRMFNDAGTPKLVLRFTATIQNNNITRLETETRVFCPDRASRLKFSPYWYLIRPVSGMIRGRILNNIKKASEGFSHS
jgi:hypothetical protein